MIRKKRNIYTLYIACVLIGITYINYIYNDDIFIDNIKTHIINGFKNIKINNEKSDIDYKGIKFSINMPVINYEDTSVERYINTYIRRNINQFVNLKKQEKDISKNNYSDISINYHMVFEDKNILNIIIYKDMYINDKKYERIKDSYIFDLKTGQRIYLDNFLKNNEDYKYILENYILNKIDRDGLDIEKEKININKYTNYYITDEGIGVYFNPYQISDRKEIYEFKIPVTAFKKKIKEVDTTPIVAHIDLQTITNDTKYINSIVNIPIIITDNKDIEKSINNMIKNDIMSAYNKVEQDAKAYLKNAPEGYENPYIYNVDFKVKKNSDNMLSILVSYYQYSGGAHGFYENESYNIFMENGKNLKLKDLFKENIDYKKVINDIILKQIKENKEDMYSFKEISDNQKFFIEDNKLVIYYDLYEIAPFVAGIPEFKIDINEISHIVNSKYIDIFK